MIKENIVFKDDEQSDFFLATSTIIGIVQAAIASAGAIRGGIKKKRQAEAERRAARMKFYEELARINQRRVSEGKKKLTTEMLAIVTIAIVILVTVLLYKFTFVLKARN